jgi:chitinase
VLTVTLSAASPQTVTVDYATANFSAVAGSDYTAQTGTLTFPAGSLSQSIKIPVTGDTQVEPDESFTVSLNNPQNATLDDTAKTATVTLQNDDIPILSIAPAQLQEGNAGSTEAVVTVTLSSASYQPVTVDYGTANGTAQAGVDYSPVNGSLTFDAGVTTQEIRILVTGDSQIEPDETFTVSLSNAQNATLNATASQATVTIINDDLPPPELSVAATEITEGQSGTSNAVITVQLSRAATLPVSVSYATADGSATAGSDYTASSGTLHFAAGETRQTINIPVVGDTFFEANETFLLKLSDPLNATLSATASQSTVTIINDDTAPVLSIADLAVLEGNAGVNSVPLTVTLSAAASQTITVTYATADGTAQAGSDYTATTGTLSFAPGQTSQQITVPVNGDGDFEPDEKFTVTLSAPQGAVVSDTASQATVTLINDDPKGFTANGGFDFDLDDTNTNLQGTDQNDRINALGGNDTLDGGLGDDSLTGGLGDDRLIGNLGDDTLVGNAGNDDLDGGDGNDLLQGNEGADQLFGGKGNDTLEGGVSDISQVAGPGNKGDTLEGGAGDDLLTTTEANDVVKGGEGHDTIQTGAGDDTVEGGDGDDRIDTGAGNDSIQGGEGNDMIQAGAGNDTIKAYYGFDTIEAGEGNDTIFFYNGYRGDPVRIDGGAGDDNIYENGGDSGDDTLLGGAGNDVIGRYKDGDLTHEYGNDYIDGGTGDDFLNAGEGNDQVLGGEGSDTLVGGEDNDALTGGEGSDALDGGSGNDTLTGGAGIDILTGGDGDDVFIFNPGDSGVGAGNRDIITDFNAPSTTEVIDLHGLSTSALSFKGTAAFTGANQVNYKIDVPNNMTIIQVNLDTDLNTTEMEIELTGIKGLIASDFVLATTAG